MQHNNRVSTITIAATALGIAASVSCASVAAEDLDTVELLTQGDVETLAENLGAATHYRAATPIEQLGVIGFDVGIGLASTELDEDLIDRASGGDAENDNFLSPRVHVQKGLPFGLDIGAFAGNVLDTDLTLLGAELRYAIVEGGVALPAVGVRASYTRADGNDDLDIQNFGLELGISKGFLMFTPYGGIGAVRTELTPDTGTLDEETVTQEKYYVGLNINLGFNIVLEADRTGDYDTVSAKVGVRF